MRTNLYNFSQKEIKRLLEEQNFPLHLVDNNVGFPLLQDYSAQQWT
jgi:hypothetical protein